MDRKVQEQKLLQAELKSLPKGAKVYKQQQNSNIFFKTTKEKAFEDCKRTLDSIVGEYKEAENLQNKKGQSEEQTDENG